jgi:hypothetical protein
MQDAVGEEGKHAYLLRRFRRDFLRWEMPELELEGIISCFPAKI